MSEHGTANTQNNGDLCQRCGEREAWFVSFEERYDPKTGRASSTQVPGSFRCRECSDAEQEEYREKVRKAGIA